MGWLSFQLSDLYRQAIDCSHPVLVVANGLLFFSQWLIMAQHCPMFPDCTASEAYFLHHPKLKGELSFPVNTRFLGYHASGPPTVLLSSANTVVKIVNVTHVMYLVLSVVPSKMGHCSTLWSLIQSNNYGSKAQALIRRHLASPQQGMV